MLILIRILGERIISSITQSLLVLHLVNQPKQYLYKDPQILQFIEEQNYIRKKDKQFQVLSSNLLRNGKFLV